MTAAELGWWGVPLAMLAGALRVSVPFIWVSLGECLTERAGRINLGLEGTLVLGAMSAYATAVETGSPWLGVLAAMLVGALWGALHSSLCSLPRVNDIAVGIALMLLGIGVAWFVGKPYIQPQAPDLPALSLGFWSDLKQLQAALTISWLLVLGVIAAIALHVFFRYTTLGLIVRTVGDSHDAARAMGYSPLRVRFWSTVCGSAMAGVGGASLSLFYPGSWNEGISSGQGLIAVALVIFARWRPLNCLWASLLFGGAGALGPALQSVGISEGYYLFYAAPYVITLMLLIVTSSPQGKLRGAPLELSITRH
ncbi:MAG: ABC transporter permease [Granulosicoccus sp.]